MVNDLEKIITQEIDELKKYFSSIIKNQKIKDLRLTHSENEINSGINSIYNELNYKPFALNEKVIPMLNTYKKKIKGEIKDYIEQLKKIELEQTEIRINKFAKIKIPLISIIVTLLIGSITIGVQLYLNKKDSSDIKILQDKVKSLEGKLSQSDPK